MSHDKIEILYPERRTISFETIKTWFLDAVDNGDVDHEFEYLAEQENPDPWQMAMALSDAGLITVSRKYV